MKTIQKINHRKKESQILDLHGNLFHIKPFYRLYMDFPFKKGKYYYTQDQYSGQTLTLIHTPKDLWYSVSYSLELNLYVLKKLVLLEYQPEKDIRNGKRRNKSKQ